MSAEPLHEQDPDVPDALVAWLGGELAPGRADHLLERLHQDAAFRRALAAEVWTLSLSRVAQAPDPRWLALHEELGWESAARTVPETHHEPVFEQALLKVIRREPLRFVAAWWRWVAAGAVAALMVLCAVLLHQPAADSARLVSPRLAVLVPGANAVWQVGNPSAGRLVGPGQVTLVSGTARLLFTTGVIVDVEGPADLRLVSVDRMICREGRLRTWVPPGAEGFCVETPRGTVTDLGTELGIAVERTGKTRVAVFEGQAEVAVQMPGQAGVRTALLNRSDMAEFSSANGEIHEPPAATPPPDVVAPPLPSLCLADGYRSLVMSAQPAHYWRADLAQAQRIPNAVDGGPALQMAGGVEVLPGAVAGSTASLHFHGRTSPGVVYAERSWRTPETGHAVEFWFVADRLEQMALAALTTTAPDRPHIGLVEVGGRRAGEEFSAACVRYLLRWPPGHRAGINLYSPPTALPYQWHHGVAQHQDGKLQLFVDGELIGNAQADAAPEAVDCVLQFGALEWRADAGTAGLRRPFSGCLAEIAVYERVLTAAEVRAHAAARR